MILRILFINTPFPIPSSEITLRCVFYLVSGFSRRIKLQLLTVNNWFDNVLFIGCLTHFLYHFFYLPDEVLALDSLSRDLPLGKSMGASDKNRSVFQNYISCVYVQDRLNGEVNGERQAMHGYLSAVLTKVTSERKKDQRM